MSSPAPPSAGELLLTGALLSLLVGLRGGAWAAGRLERVVDQRFSIMRGSRSASAGMSRSARA